MCDTVSFWMDGWMWSSLIFFCLIPLPFLCDFMVLCGFFTPLKGHSTSPLHGPLVVLFFCSCSYFVVPQTLCTCQCHMCSAAVVSSLRWRCKSPAVSLHLFFLKLFIFCLFCLFVLSVSFLCQKWLVRTVCARLSTSVIHLWLYDHVCLFCVFILVLHSLCLEVEAVLLKMRSLSDLSTSVMSPLFQNWQAESNTPFLKRKSLLHDFVACLYSPQTLSRDTVNTHTLTTESVRCSCSRRSSPDCKKKREEGSWTLCGSFCLYSQICHFLRLTNPGMHWAWR